MIAKILTLIITYTQPITVVAFLIVGVCLLGLKQWQFGIMNLILALFNLITFYGARMFK